MIKFNFNYFYVVISFGLFLSSCETLTQSLIKDPEVKVQDVIVKEVTPHEVSLDLALLVENPNAIPLKLDQIDYVLSFSGSKVTEGRFDKGIEVAANGSSKVSFPLKFNFNSINSIVEQLMNKSLKKDYEFSGTAKIGIFNIPFVKKGEVQLSN